MGMDDERRRLELLDQRGQGPCTPEMFFRFYPLKNEWV